MRRRDLVRAACALTAAPGLARAQAYPSRPIRYIVPVPAGGGNDMIARVLAERWSRALGQPFVIDNQGGGSGIVACQATARAAPDGYTLLQAYVATHGTNPATRRVPYDPVNDFTPIGMVGASPNVLVVHASVPARTLPEFIDYARRNGDKLSYASAGIGTLTHLTMELFKNDTGASLLHVPYRGAAPAIADVVGNQAQAMFPSVATALAHVRSGKLRALAVTGKRRSAQLRDVPTMEEAGLPGFDAVQWYCTVGPARMPADVVRRLHDTQAAVLSAPDLADKLVAEAVEPWVMTPAQLTDHIRSEVARWGALAKARNIH
ncbi:MAG: tripartite tricarboxylate transporter substrate binding protein, partial [Comamonadaceae bacterium]